MDTKSAISRDRKYSASIWALMGRHAGVPFIVMVVALSTNCWAQSSETSFQPVNVTGQAPISAYGAPEAFSRSRLGTLTQTYVLPAFTVYTGLDYEFTVPRQGLPDHLFTQELEIGLPYRFGVAIENNVDAFHGSVRESSVSIETRYALADWDKIPLNPTLFAEYRIGVGPLNETAEVGSQPHEGDEQDRGPQRTPNAYELRLLLAEDFGDKVEWALDGFFEQELSGDRGREWGFAQSLAVPILKEREKLKLGIEMLYRNHTDHPTRGDPTQLFELGPSLAWKLTRSARLDVTPLFGTTSAGPAVQTFVVLSFLLGPPGEGGEREPEAPTSTRNR
ncbi:MAG: hypothetical protein JOZ08_24870 [Verrucomicrobia bacterium]|nr:hypothetical protein [Verrucomicrobiota bacterium]